MDKHEEYKQLYKKFIDGKRWFALNKHRGIVTPRDRAEFRERVINPMARIRATFTPEEREYWKRVAMMVELFGGTIVLKGYSNNNKQGG